MIGQTPRSHECAGITACPGALAILALISAVTVAAGCDERRPNSPADPSASQSAATNPTTQPADDAGAHDVTNQELTPVPLGAIPFAMNAPKGWKFKSRAGVLTLEGPTIAGTAQIQIVRHMQPIAGHAERLVEGAKKEIAAEPGPYNKCDVRTVGGVQVLEFRKLGRPTGAPAIDATGKQIAPGGTSMQWKLTAFVRRAGGTEKDLDMCEIGFVDLTREQYDIDKELLEKMIVSLKYDPSAVSN